VQSFKSEFERRKAAVVVVSFAEPEVLVRYQNDHQWPFKMLADPERRAYRAFSLRRLSLLEIFSPATLKLYWRLLRRGHKSKRYAKQDVYQAGGDFVLDRAGNILFAYRSQEPADRPSAADLLAAIDGIREGQYV
jgi:peroxiredoxin